METRLKFFLQYPLPLMLWMAFIFWASSIPNLTTGEGPSHHVLRKIAHLLEFGFLAFLWLRFLEKRSLTKQRYWRYRGLSVPISLLGAFLFSLLYAMSDEWHQSLVASRDGKVSDVFIDGLGAVGGLYLAQTLGRRFGIRS